MNECMRIYVFYFVVFIASYQFSILHFVSNIYSYCVRYIFRFFCWANDIMCSIH